MMKRLVEHDDIDHILSREGEILPSSGFAVSVMDAVRREAAVPPPIPFPWKRALPGVVVGGFALVLMLIGVLVVLAQPESAASTPQVSPFYMPSSSVLTPLHRDLELAAVWTIAALLAAFVSVKVSMRVPSGGV